MISLAYLREQYLREAEQYEAEAAAWAAKAARENDDRLRDEYDARARQKRRAAQVAYRLLADVEARIGEINQLHRHR